LGMYSQLSKKPRIGAAIAEPRAKEESKPEQKDASTSGASKPWFYVAPNCSQLRLSPNKTHAALEPDDGSG
jgi:hypothetical protein